MFGSYPSRCAIFRATCKTAPFGPDRRLRLSSTSMALPILFSSVALALLAISTSTTGLSIGSPKSLLPATTAILTAGSVLRPVFVTGYTFLSVAEPPSKVCRDESPLSAVKKASYIPSTCVDYQLFSKIPDHRHLHAKKCAQVV